VEVLKINSNWAANKGQWTVFLFFFQSTPGQWTAVHQRDCDLPFLTISDDLHDYYHVHTTANLTHQGFYTRCFPQVPKKSWLNLQKTWVHYGYINVSSPIFLGILGQTSSNLRHVVPRSPESFLNVHRAKELGMKLRRCRCSHGTQAYRDHVLLEAELLGVVAEAAAEEVSSGEIWADEMPFFCRENRI
jgi:hypothetical protein